MTSQGRIRFHTVNKSTYSLDIDDDTTFYEIRRKLKNVYSDVFKPDDTLRFIFRSKFIEDDKKLSDIKNKLDLTDSIAICPNKMTNYNIRTDLILPPQSHIRPSNTCVAPVVCPSNETSAPAIIEQPKALPSIPMADMQSIQMQNLETLQNNEQVQTLVQEGYTPNMAFKALLDNQGNINKARKALQKNRIQPDSNTLPPVYQPAPQPPPISRDNRDFDLQRLYTEFPDLEHDVINQFYENCRNDYQQARSEIGGS